MKTLLRFYKVKQSRILPWLPVIAYCLLMSSSVLCYATVGDAAGTARTVVTGFIVPLLRIIAIPAGAIYVVTGAVKYAQAHAEGEGPAMHKAINQIVAGIAVITIGVIIGSLPYEQLFDALKVDSGGSGRAVA